jgi:hypothetical protein
MLQSFSLARFRFVLEPQEHIALHPKNPGNTSRGAFGATFKRLVCPWPIHPRRQVCPVGNGQYEVVTPDVTGMW